LTVNITSSKKWFEGLNSIRFILAFIVVLSHFDDPYIKDLINSSSEIAHLSGIVLTNLFDGTAAVVAFFIISGFVIHYPNKNGLKNLKKFWIRRFIRILLPLMIIFIIGIRFGHPEKTVIWSLICELIYYVIYPFIFSLPLTWRKKFIIAFIAAAALIVIRGQNDLLSLLTQRNVKYHSYYWQAGIFLTWIVGLPVWLMGVLLAEEIDKISAINFSRLIFYRMSVFIISCLLTYARGNFYLSYLISMNLFAFCIYRWIRAEIIYFKHKRASRVLERAGKFSYSLYLCHPFIYLLLTSWLNKTETDYPLIILCTILLSYLYYLTVERPSHLLAELIAKNNGPGK
jgi:peptidoglycan/LPS O-acetylase OafA/YrhL